MERLISYRVVREGSACSRRDRGFAWGKLVIAVFVVILIAALLFPVFAQDKNGGYSRTMDNLKRLATANTLYAEDFDGRLPVAERWMDSIVSREGQYPIAEETLIDPELSERKDGQYGFAFYKPLSSIEIASVANPWDFPMLFQSTLLERNATGDLSTLPDQPRNGHTNYFATLDTHVSSRKPPWPESPIVLSFKPDSEDGEEVDEN
ncbi:MAG: hypothetical protein IH944_07625 [Armatimonadetes bacterium]|nr:hypothetical protein [Armatimonadota bacterium]